MGLLANLCECAPGVLPSPFYAMCATFVIVSSLCYDSHPGPHPVSHTADSFFAFLNFFPVAIGQVENLAYKEVHESLGKETVSLTSPSLLLG